MVHVIFAYSHLYFKNLNLVTHFFCLAHSAVHILVSTSYKAPGNMSAESLKKKKKTASAEQVGLLYKFEHSNTSEVQAASLTAALH